jgi:hypothetical protein
VAHQAGTAPDLTGGYAGERKHHGKTKIGAELRSEAVEKRKPRQRLKSNLEWSLQLTGVHQTREEVIAGKVSLHEEKTGTWGQERASKTLQWRNEITDKNEDQICPTRKTKAVKHEPKENTQICKQHKIKKGK